MYKKNSRLIIKIEKKSRTYIYRKMSHTRTPSMTSTYTSTSTSTPASTFSSTSTPAPIPSTSTFSRTSTPASTFSSTSTPASTFSPEPIPSTSTFSPTSTSLSIEYDISYTPKPSSLPLNINYSNDSSNSGTLLIISILIPFLLVCLIYNIVYHHIKMKEKQERQNRIRQEILIIQENPLYSANV